MMYGTVVNNALGSVTSSVSVSFYRIESIIDEKRNFLLNHSKQEIYKVGAV